MSRSPPETAVAFKREVAVLMAGSPTFRGAAIPSAVQPWPTGSSAPSALASACAAGAFAGFTVGGPASVPGVQSALLVTLMHARSGNVHVPSATPSWSHPVPSTQLAVMPGNPLHSMTQSVRAGPPPGRHTEGHWARARPPSAAAAITTTVASRIGY